MHKLLRKTAILASSVAREKEPSYAVQPYKKLSDLEPRMLSKERVVLVRSRTSTQ